MLLPVPWQYWLCITKPKSAFSMTLNASTTLFLENGVLFIDLLRLYSATTD